MRHTLTALLLALPLAAHAGLVECRDADGSWYGASDCSMGGTQVAPHNLIAGARQCVADMDEAVRRERAIGRETGYVNAAVLYGAGRRKLECQRNLADFARQVKALGP